MKKLLLSVGFLAVLATVILLPANSTSAAPNLVTHASSYGEYYTIDGTDIQGLAVCVHNNWVRRHKRLWFNMSGSSSNVSNIHLFHLGKSPRWDRWGGEITHGWGSGPGGRDYYILIDTSWSWFNWVSCIRPNRFRIDYDVT